MHKFTKEKLVRNLFIFFLTPSEVDDGKGKEKSSEAKCRFPIYIYIYIVFIYMKICKYVSIYIHGRSAAQEIPV